MKYIRNWLKYKNRDERSVIWLLIKGYAFLCLLCFGCLLLPIFQNEPNKVIDHLFFAVSLVSTTGLTPADFASSYNIYGQVISLLFIQLGGIGYMALGSFIVIKSFNKLPNISANLLRLEFNLPQRYPLLDFIYSVFAFTILIETLGAFFLYFGFKAEGVAQPLWSAIFHSISAFCTAGFSLYSDSLSACANNGLITSTILILSLLGSIGFIVFSDFWMKLRSKRKFVTLTSKIIIISTFTIIAIGALFVFISDATLLQQGFYGFGIAIFQTVSAHTTVGFNNCDIGSLSTAAIFTLTLLMIIGASPSGTGGGIKTTSLTAIFAVLKSILKKQQYITFLKKEIPASNIFLAVASAIFYLLIFIAGTWLLLLIEGDKLPSHYIIFEASSALSTVGISAGITAELSNMGKLVIAGLMFLGRIGVLSFGLALLKRAPLLRETPKAEDIAI